MWFCKRLAVPLALLFVYSAAYSQFVQTGYKVNSVTQPLSFGAPTLIVAQSVPVYGNAKPTSSSGKTLRYMFAPVHEVDRILHPREWEDLTTSDS